MKRIAANKVKPGMIYIGSNDCQILMVSRDGLKVTLKLVNPGNTTLTKGHTWMVLWREKGFKLVLGNDCAQCEGWAPEDDYLCQTCRSL